MDLTTVVNFAERVSALAAYRLRLHTYLKEKMNSVAPNLAALIGEQKTKNNPVFDTLFRGNGRCASYQSRRLFDEPCQVSCIDRADSWR